MTVLGVRHGAVLLPALLAGPQGRAAGYVFARSATETLITRVFFSSTFAGGRSVVSSHDCKGSTSGPPDGATKRERPPKGPGSASRRCGADALVQGAQPPLFSGDLAAPLCEGLLVLADRGRLGRGRGLALDLEDEAPQREPGLGSYVRGVVLPGVVWCDHGASSGAKAPGGRRGGKRGAGYTSSPCFPCLPAWSPIYFPTASSWSCCNKVRIGFLAAFSFALGFLNS